MLLGEVFDAHACFPRGPARIGDEFAKAGQDIQGSNALGQIACDMEGKCQATHQNREHLPVRIFGKSFLGQSIELLETRRR